MTQKQLDMKSIIVFLILVLCSCSHSREDTENAQATKNNETVNVGHNLSKPITVLSARIDIRQNIIRQISQVHHVKPPIRNVHFLNETVGFIGGVSLLRTENGGSIWTAVSIPEIGNNSINNIYFDDGRVGWLIASSIARNLSAAESKVYRSFDLGKTWEKVLQLSNVELRSVAFREDTAYFVGTKFESFHRKPTVLAVGRELNVTDLSNSFDRAFETKRLGEREELTQMQTGPEHLRVITSFGSIYSMSLNNQRWKWEGNALHESISRAICACFAGVFPGDGLIWLAGGRGGDEGTASVFAVEESDKWLDLTIDGFYLSDVKLGPDGNVFIAGDLSEKTDKGLYESRGTIMKSSDKGRTWTVVYENQEASTVTSFDFVGTNTIIAVENESVKSILLSE